MTAIIEILLAITCLFTKINLCLFCPQHGFYEGCQLKQMWCPLYTRYLHACYPILIRPVKPILFWYCEQYSTQTEEYNMNPISVVYARINHQVISYGSQEFYWIQIAGPHWQDIHDR